MEQLTLEQAALTHAPFNGNLRASFQAGAEWQKEQYKQLLNLCKSAIRDLNNCGATITADGMVDELKRLQD